MAAALQHLTDMGEIHYARVEWLTPLVRRVICENPNHFTYRGTATFLVGRGDVAIIDPGPLHPPHLDALLAALEPGESVRYVLVTHTHADHSPAATVVAERTGALTAGHGPHHAAGVSAELHGIDFSAHLSENDRARITAQMEMIPEHLRREAADTEFVPTLRLGDGDSVEGNDWRLEAVWTPGHCSNHLCFALAEESTLFSGDHVMGWSTSVIGPPDGSMGDYLQSLRKLLDRPERIYRPTHGPALDDPLPYVEALLAHRLEREREIVRLLDDGVQRISDLVAVMYAAYDRILWFPAAASVHAHLLQLVDEGRATVDRLDPSGRPAIDASYELT